MPTRCRKPRPLEPGDSHVHPDPPPAPGHTAPRAFRASLLITAAGAALIPVLALSAATASPRQAPTQGEEQDQEASRLCNSRDPEEKIRGCMIAIRTDTSDEQRAIAYNNRGSGHADKGEHAKAIADFDAAIHLNPLYAVAWLNRGIVQNEMQRFDLAMQDFNKIQ